MERKTVWINNMELGGDTPRICVPLVARDSGELLDRAEALRGVPFDIVEWRADFYGETDREDWVPHALSILRGALPPSCLVLFTFRTAEEGGARGVSPTEYEKLCRDAAASGYADLVDLELNRGSDLTERIVETLHQFGVKALLSYHNFGLTPRKEELLEKVAAMCRIGADITKLAVMPQSERDVLELLEASLLLKERYADRPYITMSMGKLGVVSRLAPALTGSAVTFASVGVQSAPGQVDARLVAELLRSENH